jgi:tryptophanyl-tRNA synthetase
MSKSRHNVIMLSASEDETAELIKKARTDAGKLITYDPINRPEVANLLNLVALTSGSTPVAVAEGIGDGGAVKLKQVLTEALNEYLRPLRTRRHALGQTWTISRQVLHAG